MMVPDLYSMVDRWWLRADFCCGKDRSAARDILSEAPDLEDELAGRGTQHIKYTLELLLASNLCTSSPKKGRQ